jgi:flagellar rod assembly protein/muramidase FlgJ
MVETPTGLMRPQQRKNDMLNDLRKMFGPAPSTPQTLEEELQSLKPEELRLVLSTASMAKLAHGFKSNNTQPYLELIRSMYPRLNARLQRIIAAILDDADPIPAVTDQRDTERDNAIKAALSEYDSLMPSQEAQTEPQQLELPLDSPDKETVPSATPEAFVASIAPAAKAVAQELGIDPRIVIAQAALETGWGTSVKGNNLFGIKSHGKQDGLMVQTHEVVDGKRIKVRDNFRQYDSYDDSIADYGSFLQQNKRYKPMLQAATLREQVEALGKSGYATDPKYADKVMAIAKSKRLEVVR